MYIRIYDMYMHVWIYQCIYIIHFMHVLMVYLYNRVIHLLYIYTHKTAVPARLLASHSARNGIPTEMIRSFVYGAPEEDPWSTLVYSANYDKAGQKNGQKNGQFII